MQILEEIILKIVKNKVCKIPQWVNFKYWVNYADCFLVLLMKQQDLKYI